MKVVFYMMTGLLVVQLDFLSNAQESEDFKERALEQIQFIEEIKDIVEKEFPQSCDASLVTKIKSALALEMLYKNLERGHEDLKWFNHIPLNDTHPLGKLILGSIPIVTQDKQQRNDIKTLVEQEEVTSILTILEEFEEDYRYSLKNLCKVFFANEIYPIPNQMWHRRGISPKIIRVQDYHGVTPELIEEGVEYIRQELLDKKNVYVHCKAGRGRSASLVVGYLMKYEDMDFETAYSYLKSKRSHINLGQDQKNTLQTYFESLSIRTQSADENGFVVISLD